MTPTAQDKPARKSNAGTVMVRCGFSPEQVEAIRAIGDSCGVHTLSDALRHTVAAATGVKP
jgi:hypothetical protein